MFLKCSWIKRLTLNYKPWMDIFIAMNSSDVVSKMLDFGDSFIKKMIKQNNTFWQDVLQSWVQVENILNKNHDYIKKFISSVTLWYNSLIIPEDHIFFIKIWYQNGIKLISDFLNVNGSFMSYDEFLNNYNLPNV